MVTEEMKLSQKYEQEWEDFIRAIVFCIVVLTSLFAVCLLFLGLKMFAAL